MIPALIAGGVALAGAATNYLSNREKTQATQDLYNDLADRAAAVERLQGTGVLEPDPDGISFK